MNAFIDKYEETESIFSNEVIQPRQRTLLDAKAFCSSSTNCIGIIKRVNKDGNFYVAAAYPYSISFGFDWNKIYLLRSKLILKKKYSEGNNRLDRNN